MRYSDFMCYCGSPSEPNRDNRVQCDALMTRTRIALGCDDSDMLSAVIFAMEHGLETNKGWTASAGIDGIACDQWCGVSGVVSVRPPGKKYVEIATIFVQCDWVEHGVARVYELAKQAVREFDEDLTQDSESA